MRLKLAITILAAIGFAMVLLTGMTGPARAQQEHVDMSKIQKIPTYDDELPKEEFDKQSEVYEEYPPGDKYLSYSVRLPKGWYKASSSINMTHKKNEIEKAEISQRILGLVAKYYGPSRIESLSYFAVQAQALDFEVTAKNWFLQELLVRGYVLEGLKIVSDKRVEALYVTVEGDTAYVVRSAAEINGPRIIVASYNVPDKFFDQEKAQQQKVIESFQFLSPEKSRIEMTKSYAFLDLLSFEYPISWRLVAPDIYSIEGMEASLTYSIDEHTMSGQIHMSIVSTEWPNVVQEEVSFMKQDLASKGLELGDLLEKKTDFKLPSHVFYNYTEIYKAQNPDEKIIEHEFWISIMEEERYFYIVTMLTPARTSEFYTWARNAEAYQTVVESFKP